MIPGFPAGGAVIRARGVHPAGLQTVRRVTLQKSIVYFIVALIYPPAEGLIHRARVLWSSVRASI